MTADLDAPTKDAALEAMFRHSMYLGLAFAVVEDEETDPAYERQPITVTSPHADPGTPGKRIVENADVIRFPYNLLDGNNDIRIAFLADVDGVIRWSDNLERPLRLAKGEAVVFEPGDLKIGIP